MRKHYVRSLPDISFDEFNPLDLKQIAEAVQEASEQSELWAQRYEELMQMPVFIDGEVVSYEDYYC